MTEERLTLEKGRDMTMEHLERVFKYLDPEDNIHPTLAIYISPQGNGAMIPLHIIPDHLWMDAARTMKKENPQVAFFFAMGWAVAHKIPMEAVEEAEKDVPKYIHEQITPTFESKAIEIMLLEVSDGTKTETWMARVKRFKTKSPTLGKWKKMPSDLNSYQGGVLSGITMFPFIGNEPQTQKEGLVN